ncbi:hypothetical protein GXM_07948 [Nostoc sphaeroides CCNUC1]|uniref:Uncharacterized protein n=1 Tax=Nostoc sphaeroides CCNUC1 TaxID=2653204 RepID=A0A5P8WCU8_9NOSO|nr:hypothetical protein GXM_07948 [Nostoc sphaeroides CCNUC1]
MGTKTSIRKSSASLRDIELGCLVFLVVGECNNLPGFVTDIVQPPRPCSLWRWYRNSAVTSPVSDRNWEQSIDLMTLVL